MKSLKIGIVVAGLYFMIVAVKLPTLWRFPLFFCGFAMILLMVLPDDDSMIVVSKEQTTQDNQEVR